MSLISEEVLIADLFWLSDDAWEAIEPHLPRGKPGKPRVDDRTVISGILHILKVGCRWRDVPAAYGPPTTIYNRYHRWSQRGIIPSDFEAYKARNLIERCFNKLKHFRRIATRYDRRATYFLSFIHLAAAMLWMR